jgi:hypothetical protein
MKRENSAQGRSQRTGTQGVIIMTKQCAGPATYKLDRLGHSDTHARFRLHLFARSKAAQRTWRGMGLVIEGLQCAADGVKARRRWIERRLQWLPQS